MNSDFWSSSESVTRYAQMEFKLWDIEALYLMESCAGLGKRVSEIKILDIGCGGGRTTVPLYNMGFDVTAIDISEPLIKSLKEKNPNIKCFVGDAMDLKFPDNEFDIVLFSHNGLDYIYPESNRSSTVNEIRRVLRNEGYFVFSTYEFPLLPYDVAVAKNIIKNISQRLSNSNKGYFIEEMKNKSKVTTYYSSKKQTVIDICKEGFKFIDSSKLITMPENYLRQFVANSLGWERYYLFKNEHRD